MPMVINPYIGFVKQAEEAMKFYQSVFGGELVMNTYKEFNMSQSPETDNLIMHAMLTMENDQVLMGSDNPPSMPFSESIRVSISLSGEDEAKLKAQWEKLADGGQVIMPMAVSPWKDQFGMLVDKYGIQWMVNINAPKA